MDTKKLKIGIDIDDRIYGKEKINEKILSDLINTDSFQKLKDVSQLGMPDEYSFKKGFSRYEHSLGVLILLRKLGAGLEEQIAGLLHDINHTAFSHVVDWIFGNPEKEDYQDNTLLYTIKNSEIKKILEDNGFDYKKISNHKNFPLLERPAPKLCADRIDYSLRELTIDKNENHSKVKKIYNNLDVKDNQIIFTNQEISKVFAKEYMELQENSWGGDQARTRYYLLSEALKKGLEKDLISLSDFNNAESYVLNKLKNSKDSFILNNLNILKKGFNVIEFREGIKLKKKFRYIDPEVLYDSSYKSLSFLSKEYSEFLNLKKEKSRLTKKVNIVPI